MRHGRSAPMRPLIEPADGRPDMLAGLSWWQLALVRVTFAAYRGMLRVVAWGERRGWVG